MKYANLHLHSTFSDTQFTPLQLILIGKALGYHALALTDHETDGGVKEFMEIARAQGLQSISGAEFFGVESGMLLHITALDYDMNNPGIRAFIKDRCNAAMVYTQKCFELGTRLGIIQGLTWNDILDFNPEGTWLCINSIINVLRLKRLVPCVNDWTTLRSMVFDSPEALAHKEPYPTAEEVIKLIRNAGGVAALAHPNNQTHLVGKLVEYGLNGIEISHPSLRDHTPYLALEAAETYHLYRCGGTDHTGPMSGNGGNWAIPVFNGITEEEFNILRERRLG